MKTPNNTIKISELCKNYGNIIASDHISFTAKKGDIIAVLGPNGAGKSTLMNMIAGYLAPTSGEITVLGCDIAQHALFAKQNIGFLAEGAPLYPDISVEMFLSYMAQIRGVSRQKMLQVAGIANITDVLAQKIETLSKGYQRRVGFAQSILSDPPILLLDEPTDGLDPNQKDYMHQLIKDMSAHKTILISTHLLDEAETICNRIIIIDHGRIQSEGTLKEILKSTQSKNLQQAFRRLTQRED